MDRFRNTLLATTALMPFGIIAAAANPLGSQVVGGAANVQGQGTSAVTVTQSTDKAIINWQTFNISKGETTQFVQPNSSSVTLNRVTGGFGASNLDGTLTANGRVFLVNPDGILFGAGSKINTGSFLATTNDIRNADFMAGRYQFNIPGRPDASIVNLGTITAQNGGFAALVAPGVRNTGTITANLGTVGLAAGNNFSLDFYGDRLIMLGVNDSVAAKVIDIATGQPLNALVQNDGKLKANGGRVELTAAATRQVVDSVINNTGVIEANSIGNKNGIIVLGAATAATKPTGAPTQTIKVSGTISATGKRKNTKGGSISVSGENIQLTSATIDASGQAGGGKVLIGGDVGGGKGNAAVAGNSKAALESFTVATASTVSVDAASIINASAKANGGGGKVVVWSDQATTFYGTIKARGGAQSGNGGFVETSGHQTLTFNGVVDTSATNGKSGALLLDPLNATVSASSGPGVITTSNVVASLATGDVLITTGQTGNDVGNITVASDVVWSGNSNLSIFAFHDIIINGGVTIKSVGGGSLDLLAGQLIYLQSNGIPVSSGTGSGTVQLLGNIDFSQSTGQVFISYNPVGGYANPTNFLPHIKLNPIYPIFTAAMAVNNITDLQNINQNLSGTYNLTQVSYDATVTASWNGGQGFIPIGTSIAPFSGTLLGPATINNLTIHSSATDVGLFGYNAGLVQSVGLTNANITSTSGNQHIGALAGVNAGFIVDSFATGTLSTSSLSVNLGGLVGKNLGNIFDSYTAGIALSSNGSVPSTVGGFVGLNAGVISSSYSAASLSNANGNVGQFVGLNNLQIFFSYALSGAFPFSGFNQSPVYGSFVVSDATLKGSLLTGFGGFSWALDGSINSGYPSLQWQQPFPPVTNLTVYTPSSPPTVAPPGPSPVVANFSARLFNQTAQFAGLNTSIANSTPQTSPLPNYETITGQNIYVPPPSGNIKVTTNVITPAAGSALTSSLSRDLTAVNAEMDLNESYHLHDATLFHDIVSTLGLNKDYSKDSSGYIYPSNYGTSNREECVALVLALKPSLSQNTNNWTKGVQVDLNEQQNSALQPGMAIATFNPNGSYPGATGVLSDGVTIAHTAIFLGYAIRNGQFGMYVLDQYTAHPGATAQPAEIRFDPLTPAKANLYFSISTK